MELHPNCARRLQALASAGQSARAVHFASDDGTPVVVTACGAALRLRIGKATLPDYGLLQNVDAGALTVTRSAPNTWLIAAGDLALELAGAPLRIKLLRGSQVRLASITDEHFRGWPRIPCFGRMQDSEGGGWTCAFALASGESVYGLGEKFGPLDKRGQLIHSAVEDALGVNTGLSYKNAAFC